MIVVVIPAKNEADNIGLLVRAILQHADKVVVANDSSTDETVSCAYKAGAEVVNIPPGRAGLADVYRCGLRYALVKYPYARAIVEMDAGWSHHPMEMGRLIRALDGNDVAFAYRFGPRAVYSASFKRRALSWLGTKFTNWLFGQSWKDATSGYAAYSPRALQRILSKPMLSKGHYYNTEVRLTAVELGLNVAQAPITYRSSSSSLRASAVGEALWLSLWYAADRLAALAAIAILYALAAAAILNLWFTFEYWSVMLALAGAAWFRAAGWVRRMMRA